MNGNTGDFRRLSALLLFIACMIFIMPPSADSQTKGKKKPAQEKIKAKQTPKKKPAPRKKAAKPPAVFDESMSGVVEWRVVLRDDNGDVELPKRYRSWWYVCLDGVNPGRVSRLNIEGDGFRGGTIVLPVYSYDRENWFRLSPENIERGVEKDGLYNYTIKKRFDSSTVYLARYYPYTYSRLIQFLKKHEKNPYLKVETIGKTSRGRPLLLATITDPSAPDKGKRRVWIHSRTHPSETGSSFVVEGLIDYLLGDCNKHCKEVDLSGLIFNIVPMLNIDGVVEGSARVTPGGSLDLERMWLRDPADAGKLLDSCPPEVKAIHAAITRLDKAGPKFFAALNIHSKNAPPHWRPFIYTNFRRVNKEYGPEGDSMFVRHLGFIKILSGEYPCDDTLLVLPSFERELPIEKKAYPEAWWWLNFKDGVMAATLEMTSGVDGCFEEWVGYRDHLLFGESLAKALQKYYNYYVEKKWPRWDSPETDMEKLMMYYKGGPYGQ